jgi:zinc finger protein 830
VKIDVLTIANKWDGHLMTKQHRTSVAREKAIQAKAEARLQTQSKRSAEDGPSSSKRARVDAPAAGGGVDDDDGDEQDDRAGNAGPSLPAGFFSSGSGPTVTRQDDEEDDDDDDDDDDDGEIEGGASRLAQNIAGATADIPHTQSQNSTSLPPQPTGDDELDTFLASLAEPDVDAGSASTSAIPPTAVSAAARRRPTTYKELLPGQASYEAAPIRINPAGEQEAQEEEELEQHETEAEKRERLKREEREEIMGRLEEEERAQ